MEPNGASFQPGSHSKSTGAKFTRVDPAQSHQKQKSPSTKVSIKDRLKSLIRRSNAGHAKKPADSIFDLDRGMVGLGSERRLNVAP